MSELALKLIRENIEKYNRGEDATFLDLGNCGMTDVPEEIGECVWVEEMVLGNYSYNLKSEELDFIESVNKGQPNKIAQLSKSMYKLVSLKILWIQGQYRESFDISDLTSLSNLKNLEFLNCSYTQISDLSPLSGLKNLKGLYCDNTQVSVLTPLSELSKLIKLSCGLSKIITLSDITPLVNLQTLIFYETVVSDLSPLAELKNLKELIAYNTQISNLSILANLTNLQEINISNTNVTDLTPLIGLDDLRVVVIGNNKIKNLVPLTMLKQLNDLYIYGLQIQDISVLAEIVQLRKLSAWNNPISDLTPLSNLLELHTIYVHETQVSDLSPLSGLVNLRTLGFSDTLVSDLSPLIRLKNLHQLELENTLVTDLSPILTLIKDKKVPVKHSRSDISKEYKYNFQNMPFVLVSNSPLIIPPFEFIRDSPQAVRDYFEELGEDNQALNEVKIIFLGEASSGKTSLVKKLMKENFDSMESQTHGIRIRKAPFIMVNGDVVTAHLWDFGGQEVMHATHQFFLSNRSIYVLLLNSRNDDQVEKWLKHAASFGGKSPVLVVLNKIDENPSFEVNRKALVEKYSQIHGFYRVSAKTDEGIHEFSDALRHEIDQAETRRTPFPSHWLEVKEHFSNMQADYIEDSDYRKVCQAKEVTRKFSQDVLLQFLHDLGVIINFRNLKNFDTQILNPLWLTNGVYHIINSAKVAKDGGVLKENDFDLVINDPRFLQGNTSEKVFHYPKSKLHYIVRVMQEFELCFQLDPCTYVVPLLLPIEEPDIKLEGALLHFVIHFPEFLPDSIFPRLMVKLHSFIQNEKRWRTGMFLHKPNIFKAYAKVRWDKEDNKILIDVSGEERRRFLSFIRDAVREIVNDFTNLKYNELVPVPNCTEFKEYEELIEAEKAGEKETFIKSLKGRVLISELLDGVEEPIMRSEISHIPVRAFISYSHKDSEYLKELQSALAPLMRLNKLKLWNDREIDAGTEWEEVIYKNLDEADIIICLVSADFVASDFCYNKEFAKALEDHRSKEKTIIPIRLRKTDWDGLPIAEIQGTPGEWITSSENRDEAWTTVSMAIRQALDQAKLRKQEIIERNRRENDH